MKKTILTLLTVATLFTACQSVDDLRSKQIQSVKNNEHLTESQKEYFLLQLQSCQDKECLNIVKDEYIDVSADAIVQEALNPQSTDPESTEPNTWSWAYQVDEMTNDSIRMASIRSNNFVSLDFPYEGKTYGTIYIRSIGESNDVMFVIDRGQYTSEYKVDSWQVKFDDNDPLTYKIIEPSSGSSETLFLSPQKSFIENVNNSDSTKIQVSLYEYGNHTFTFNTKDLNWKY